MTEPPSITRDQLFFLLDDFTGASTQSIEQLKHLLNRTVFDVARRPTMIVWCVWTESGEYEDWSRDLRGIFATEELAQAHADQIKRDSDHYHLYEVLAEEVRTDLPARVPYIRWSAHIRPDGTEDRDLGFCRGKLFDTWSNEITPVTGLLKPWAARRDAQDLYIEVVGSDATAVKAEYKRLLALARNQLHVDRPGRLGRERADDNHRRRPNDPLASSEITLKVRGTKKTSHHSPLISSRPFKRKVEEQAHYGDQRNNARAKRVWRLGCGRSLG